MSDQPVKNEISDSQVTVNLGSDGTGEVLFPCATCPTDRDSLPTNALSIHYSVPNFQGIVNESAAALKEATLSKFAAHTTEADWDAAFGELLKDVNVDSGIQLHGGTIKLQVENLAALTPCADVPNDLVKPLTFTDPGPMSSSFTWHPPYDEDHHFTTSRQKIAPLAADVDPLEHKQQPHANPADDLSPAEEEDMQSLDTEPTEKVEKSDLGSSSDLTAKKE